MYREGTERVWRGYREGTERVWRGYAEVIASHYLSNVFTCTQIQTLYKRLSLVILRIRCTTKSYSKQAQLISRTKWYMCVPCKSQGSSSHQCYRAAAHTIFSSTAEPENHSSYRSIRMFVIDIQTFCDLYVTVSHVHSCRIFNVPFVQMCLPQGKALL